MQGQCDHSELEVYSWGAGTDVCVFSKHLKRGEAWGEQAFETGPVWDQISLLALASGMILSQ